MQSIDLFSGIGGNAFAFRSFATPVMYCEVDESAVRILHSAMAKGYIPKAPVHDDVTTLIGTPLYEHAKTQRPLLISGSWPCQGNSKFGKKMGMADERSGLLRTLCQVVLDAKPEVFFSENVPSVVKNGSYDYLLKQLGEHYDIKHVIVRASDVGFPHMRARFFCVGVRTGFSTLPFFYESLDRLLPRAAEPPRTSNVRTYEWRDQMHALGNAVVPAASYYAYLCLTGNLGGRTPPQPHAGLPMLVFDPQAYGRPASRLVNKNQRHASLPGAVMLPRWSTPRAAAFHACHTLSERTIRDLATQVRFERGTPDAARAWLLNVAWVCWLMGFPDNYTDIPGAPPVVGAAGAFRKGAVPPSKKTVVARPATV